METPYRKVTFEIKHEDHEQTILVGKHATFKFNPNTISGEELTDFLSGCDETPDPTSQLQADKAELLELMEELHGMFSDNPDMMGEYAELYKNKTGRIIQKMKQ